MKAIIKIAVLSQNGEVLQAIGIDNIYTRVQFNRVHSLSTLWCYGEQEAKDLVGTYEGGGKVEIIEREIEIVL